MIFSGQAYPGEKSNLARIVETLWYDLRHSKLVSRLPLPLYSFSKDINQSFEDSAFRNNMLDLVNHYVRNKEDLPSSTDDATQEEIDLFVAFAGTISSKMHLYHERRSRKPYYTHPDQMNKGLNVIARENKVNISMVNSVAILYHDLVEERIDAEFPKSYEPAREFALRMQIYLETYNFIRRPKDKEEEYIEEEKEDKERSGKEKKDKEDIKHKEYFYRALSSVAQIVNNLTRDKESNYIEYLNDNIFYPQEADPDDPGLILDMFFSGNRKLGNKLISTNDAFKALKKVKTSAPDIYKECKGMILGHIPRLYKVDNMDSLFDSYFEDVLRSRDEHITEMLAEKNVRRTIIIKLCDAIHNASELVRKSNSMHEGYTVPETLKQYYKGFLIANAAMEKYGQETEGVPPSELEHMAQYNKIKPLLETLLLNIQDQAKKDSDYLRDRIIFKDGNSEKILEINTKFQEYRKISDFNQMTEKPKDKSGFAGTFQRYIMEIIGLKGNIAKEDDLHQQYKDLLVIYFQTVRFVGEFRKYNAGELAFPPKVGGLGLREGLADYTRSLIKEHKDN